MIKFVCPLIAVTDINRSKKFYTELLEQTIKFDFGKNVVFNGDFAIHDLNHFKELIENREVIKQSNNFELYFENDNVDSIAMKLKNDAVDFIHELKHSLGSKESFGFMILICILLKLVNRWKMYAEGYIRTA